MLGSKIRTSPSLSPFTKPTEVINEPSAYLQQLQQLLKQKQEELSKTANDMQQSVEKLESNIQLMKDKLSTLETAKKNLEKELTEIDEKLKNAPDPSRHEHLKSLYRDLVVEKSRIDREMSEKLTQVNDLEISLESKEREWKENKKELVERLKTFENNELVPYLTKIEDIMKLTKSKIEASNIKLTKYMTGEMDFGGSDPFVTISEKFQEKLVSRQDLFNESNFGEEHDEEEYDKKFDSSFDLNYNFGKKNEEDIEENIEQIEDDEDDEDDEEIEFGSELDEESSESSNED